MIDALANAEFDTSALTPRQLDWFELRDPYGDLEEVALVALDPDGTATFLLSYDNERPWMVVLSSNARLLDTVRV